MKVARVSCTVGRGGGLRHRPQEEAWDDDGVLLLAYLLKRPKVRPVVVRITGGGEPPFDWRENIMRATRVALDPHLARDGFAESSPQ